MDCLVSQTYTYGNADWKDLLTAYDGQTITYDAVGNPLSYYNGKSWNFTWTEGRRLASAVSGDTSISYTYDANGYRTAKYVNGVTHNYTYLGGKLVKETWGENTLEFAYDESGRPFSVTYNDTTYYYVLNLQGDVVRIVDSTGVTQASYVYDAWGNLLNTVGEGIGAVNPLRYRGYVWDDETGLYYLNSRYYDAVVRRFISVDGYLSTGQDVVEKNMFAYCNNNPAIFIDSFGAAPGLLQPVIGSLLVAAQQSLNYASKEQNKPEQIILAAKKKPNMRPNPNKRKGSENRQPSHNRERNVGHPNGEEHSRVPKGNRGISRIEETTAFAGVVFTSIVIVEILVNDITGIGVADDAALIPTAALWWEYATAAFG